MLDERMQDGYVAQCANDDVVQTCDRWLEVWDGFKFHFGPEMTRVRDVDVVFHGTEYFINRCARSRGGLANAGVHDPRRAETLPRLPPGMTIQSGTCQSNCCTISSALLAARVRYVNEFLVQFTAEDDEQLLGNLLHAEAEDTGLGLEVGSHRGRWPPTGRSPRPEQAGVLDNPDRHTLVISR